MASLKKYKKDSDASSKKKSSTANRKFAVLKRVAEKFDRENDESPDEDDNQPTESIFRSHLERIKKLEKRGIKGEAYDIEVLKSMLTLVQDLIPVAEDTYRKWPTHLNGSALNHYINQTREIQNDLRALEDFRARAAILTKMISEEMKSLTKVFIENAMKLKSDMSELKASTDKSDLFNSFLKTYGRELQASNERMGDKVMQYIVSDDKK